ncbi:flagellar motor protein MotB [candidate division KSB1 bacterium]|nr:flagellar motor protein MotB [candidate division KSB1 bacterium]
MEIKLTQPHRSSQKESESWLLSYSDMVTLLLAFFVLFFSISQVDPGKFEQIMEYFSQSNSTPLYVLEKQFQELVTAHQLEQSVDVELTPDGLRVNFQDNLLFDSGKAKLKSKSFPVLNALAEILKSADVAERKIQIEGHTDSVPLTKNALYPTNWELSTARSSSVIRYLITKAVASKRFVAVGFADTRLRQKETSNNLGLPVNRRVSLLIK